MSEKYKGKYRSESARLQTWDYGKDAAYFITICTHDRIHFFGEIKNGRMQYSPAGTIAFVLWNEIKNHAKNVEFGEFVIMPNHVHGILILDGNELYTTQTAGAAISGAGRIVRTGHALSQPDAPPQPDALPQPDAPPRPDALSPPPSSIKTIGQQRFQNQEKNTISSIVGSYKSAVTKYCNMLNLPFGWQSRFHDHIIRDEKSFKRISEYIINNPINWSGDQFSK